MALLHQYPSMPTGLSRRTSPTAPTHHLRRRPDMADIIPLKFIKTTGGAVVAPSELNPSDTIPANVINGLVGSNLLINCGVPVVNQSGFAGAPCLLEPTVTTCGRRELAAAT
ncbi:hypothetical protein SNK04_013811 [Fusarium graminearum]